MVREEISKLPAEVSDPSPCSDLAREDAESLMEKVQDATRLLEVSINYELYPEKISVYPDLD